MDRLETFQKATRAYAEGARTLLAPSGLATGDRGRSGPVSYADLSDQAEQLLPVSERVTSAALTELEGAPPEVRAKTETALLAKVLADLEISDYLLQAARDEEADAAWPVPDAFERRRGGSRQLVPVLGLLLDEQEEETPAYRTARAPVSLDHARLQLKSDVNDALFLISSRAARSGQIALQGLLGIGLAQVAKAAGIVGMDIATILGQAEKVSRLYSAFRGFLFNAYHSIMALLGPQIAKMAAEEIPKWLEKLDLGEQLDRLTGELYHIEKTKAALAPVIDESAAELEQFAVVSKQVLDLNEGYRKKTSLIDKIMPKIRHAGIVPVAALPQGQLLMGAAYIALGAYVLFLAADYVDSTQIRSLDRVPGVRRIVEENLAAQQEG